MKTRFRAIAIAGALVLGFSATNAKADLLSPSVAYCATVVGTCTSTPYLGFAKDGEPSSEQEEVNRINSLITLGAGAAPTSITLGITTEIYDRINSTLAGPFPTAVVSGSTRVVTPEASGLWNGINVTGYQYLLAKYDGPNVGDYVWYVGGLNGTYDLPEKLGDRTDPTSDKKGLSHYTLVKSASVPDGGVTLILLGGALAGLETLRRKFRA